MALADVDVTVLYCTCRPDSPYTGILIGSSPVVCGVESERPHWQGAIAGGLAVASHVSRKKKLRNEGRATAELAVRMGEEKRKEERKAAADSARQGDRGPRRVPTG